MTGGGEYRSARDGGRGRAGPLLSLTARIETAFDLTGRTIGVACLVVLFVALLVNVLLRYLFGSGVAWAYEIHALLLPWLVAAGIVSAAARHRNITITILPDLVPARTRAVLALTVHAAILAICIGILWTMQPILKASQFQRLSTLGITQIWGYSSLVFAFGSMALTSLLNILRTTLGADVLGPGVEDTSYS